MGVQLADLGRQFRGQHQRLAEAADPVRRRVPPEVGEPGLPRRRISREPARPAPAAPAAKRRLVQIFRKVKQRRTDATVDRMDCRIGRPTQRNDQDVEPARLQRLDLLRDKGLRQARIAFNDKGDRAQPLDGRIGCGHALRRPP